MTTTRLATARTWQPAGAIECILTRRRIPYTGDPAALITRAAQLLPEWRPRRLILMLGGNDMFPSLEIGFENDDSEVRTSVLIALEASDVALMVVYLARVGEPLAGVIGCAYHDDDDGEPLSIPRKTVDEFDRYESSTAH